MVTCVGLLLYSQAVKPIWEVPVDPPQVPDLLFLHLREYSLVSLMAYRRRFRGRRRTRFSRGTRSFRRSRRVMRGNFTRRRRFTRRSTRVIRPEWKRVNTALITSNANSQVAWLDQASYIGPQYLLAPVPNNIAQGVQINQRIGNSLSRMVFKCRWSASLILVDNNVNTTGFSRNINVFLRVIVFQYKRGEGDASPDSGTDSGALDYHSVNWPAFTSPGTLTAPNWQPWTSAYSSRLFTENQPGSDPNVIPPHLARFRVNIRDEITIRHDRTYSLQSNGRSAINKKWKFRMRPYKWDELNIGSSDTLQYPQNAVRVLFLLQFPYHAHLADNATVEGASVRLDWTSDIRFTDS